MTLQIIALLVSLPLFGELFEDLITVDVFSDKPKKRKKATRKRIENAKKEDREREKKQKKGSKKITQKKNDAERK